MCRCRAHDLERVIPCCVLPPVQTNAATVVRRIAIRHKDCLQAMRRCVREIKRRAFPCAPGSTLCPADFENWALHRSTWDVPLEFRARRPLSFLVHPKAPPEIAKYTDATPTAAQDKSDFPRQRDHYHSGKRDPPGPALVGRRL